MPASGIDRKNHTFGLFPTLKHGDSFTGHDDGFRSLC